MTEEQKLIRMVEQSLAQLGQGDARYLPAMRGELEDLLNWAEDRIRSMENRHGPIW